MSDALSADVSAGGSSVREPHAGRRLLTAVLTLAALSALFAPLSVNRTAADQPRVEAGRVSFAAKPLGDYPVFLAGQWRMKWHGPTGVDIASADETLLANVPGPWTNVRTKSGAPLPVSGFATYELDIAGLTPHVTHYLHVQTICPASRVWLNGRIVSQAGKVGYSAATTQPAWKSQDITFSPDADSVSIALDVASFRHTCNGILAPPVFGLHAATQTWVKTNIAQDFLFHATLILLTVFSFVMYVFRPSDRSSPYFGVSMLLLLPASVLLGRENLMLLAVPKLDFNLMLEITYLAGIGAVASFLAYANELFPRESNKLVFLTIEALLGAALLANIWIFAHGDTYLASAVYRYIGFGFIAVLTYIVVIVGWATLRGRDGAAILFFGVIALVATVSIGVLGSTSGARSGLRDVDVSSAGLLVMLFSQVIILAGRWATLMRSAEALAADMRRLIDLSSSFTSEIRLETLLTKIVAATSQFLHAERSSLFLFDAKKNRLWTLIAEGLGSRAIHLEPAEGVAGSSFASGATINVEDAYRDERFKREVDADTGYRTRSILAMPVAARDGRKLGVLQALNRQDARSFDSGDVQRMNAFAAQAAIAIDNATLFSEVVSARNYNESILRSMSNGVVTIDTDGNIAKLNEAAAAIMEISAAAATGRNFEELLAGENAWLKAELAGVRADHRPRTFLDVDFRTGAGRAIDMNIQIEPLLGDGAPAGLLVLIEDIRREKRLEGAMRRFMTPKVVDQVLQNQDDILFGTSCKASVLFADIRNFSTMAEQLTPRATVDMLNEIFSELVEAVSANDGVLDKFMGDAVMAVFGAPISSGRDPENAVETACTMMRAIETLNLKRAARDEARLQIGIGIATGDVVAGTIGSAKRMDYTVIGDSVNLAARLQVTTKFYKAGIVVCEATMQPLQGSQLVRELDTIRVRGRLRPERIFQVLTYQDETTFPHMTRVLDAYSAGMHCAGERDWRGAIAAFENALQLAPADGPTAHQLAKARALLSTPLPDDWDGVWEPWMGSSGWEVADGQ